MDRSRGCSFPQVSISRARSVAHQSAIRKSGRRYSPPRIGGVSSISAARLLGRLCPHFAPARAKARRGELRISVPVGYIWHRDIGLGFDPELRLQEAIRFIFTRFRELGSARQVLFSMTADQVHFPRPSDGMRLVTFDWTPIRYRNVISVLKNRFYAGVYAYACLIPDFDGAFLSQESKDALWDRFYMGAPPRLRRSVERYNIVKGA